MITTLQARAQQVAHQQMDFVEAFSSLVQDALDRRRSQPMGSALALSGLEERKDLKADWTYNSKLPKRDILELATLQSIEARDGALLIRPPVLGKVALQNPSRSVRSSKVTKSCIAKRHTGGGN
jgi:hypothetical protein